MSSDVESVIETRTKSARQAQRAEKQESRLDSTKKRARFLGEDDSDDDNLFAGLELLGDEPITRTKPTEGAQPEDQDDLLWNGTGTEEGQKIKKPRIVAKMDEIRLLGDTGFPKLREQVMKFKIKGKGYETQDLKRVMTLYQLWAHQMYPRTNLKDTLVTVEKLCHKRSVQRALKDFRNPPRPSQSHHPERSLAEMLEQEQEEAEPIERNEAAEDEFDRMYPPTADAPTIDSSSTAKTPIIIEDDGNDDDDAYFDAIMKATQSAKAAPAPVYEPDFDDEQERMLLEMDDMF